MSISHSSSTELRMSKDSGAEPHVRVAEGETRWLPLESNPDVMNSFLYNLGLSQKWAVTDVFGLEPELLAMVPQPVVAVVLLYPLTEVVRARPLTPVRCLSAIQHDWQCTIARCNTCYHSLVVEVQCCVDPATYGDIMYVFLWQHRCDGWTDDSWIRVTSVLAICFWLRNFPVEW